MACSGGSSACLWLIGVPVPILSSLWGLLLAGWGVSRLSWPLLQKPGSILLPSPALGDVEGEAWSFTQLSCPHTSWTAGRLHSHVCAENPEAHVGVGLTSYSTCTSSLSPSQARALKPCFAAPPTLFVLFSPPVVPSPSSLPVAPLPSTLPPLVAI